MLLPNPEWTREKESTVIKILFFKLFSCIVKDAQQQINVATEVDA